MTTVNYELQADLAERTAVELETNGWCRGKFHARGENDGSESCLVGGMRRACGWYKDDTPEENFDAYWDLQMAIDQELARKYHTHIGAISWNDEQRDKRKVVRMLRRVARNLRARAAA